MILAYPLCVRIVVVICVFSRLVHCGPYLFDFFLLLFFIYFPDSCRKYCQIIMIRLC